MVQADVSVGEISCQQKFLHSFLNLTLRLGIVKWEDARVDRPLIRTRVKPSVNLL